jgi:glycosyltransferase involved in cell wall biosynthesis
MSPRHHRIGFVAPRLAGTDGVSLETRKWSAVLTQMGHECFYFAGESDWPADRSYVSPEAHLDHPLIRCLNVDLFDDYTRSSETSQLVQKLKEHLKEHLRQFLRAFQPDLLIAENALSLPMNVPLGLALTELIAETGLPTIGHHHDFVWERDRFAISSAGDYVEAAFPPTLPTIHHVVINSFAARELALRTGASSTLIPNVLDFESPPPTPDEYAAGFRAALGIDADAHLLLQPTRIVPRKRIQFAIELARRLETKCVLVISHASGDEGPAYADYLRNYAALLDVRVLFASDIVDHDRGQTPDGRKVYALSDVYQQADLVTYPSQVEGFGNVFLEAVYYRRPIVVSTYEIFKIDIEPRAHC